MAIRGARFSDIPRLLELMAEGHRRSRYAQVCAMSRDAAKQLLMGALQRTEVKGPGGTLVHVAEAGSTVEGFIIGVTDRVYHVGEALSATDLLFYVSARAGRLDFVRLFEAFEAWALANPRVIEIRPGITDIVDGDAAAKLGSLYERRGYQRCGAIYQRSVER